MMMMIMILTLKSDVQATRDVRTEREGRCLRVLRDTYGTYHDALSRVVLGLLGFVGDREFVFFLDSTSLERTVERPRARPRRDGGSREEKPFALL